MFKTINLGQSLSPLLIQGYIPQKQQIVDFLKPIQDEYPHVLDWYANTVLDGIEDKTRRLVTYHLDGKIIALGIAKKELNEKKICTLRVDQSFWNRGLGTMLVKDLREWLEEDLPVITVSETKHGQFKGLFEKFGFKTTNVENGLYKPRVNEIILNEKQSSLN